VKQRIWTSDWFAELVYGAVFLLAGYGIHPVGFQRLEHAAYNLGVKLTQAVPGSQIATLTIDEPGIKTSGSAIGTLTLLPQIQQYPLKLRGQDFVLALRVERIKIMH